MATAQTGQRERVGHRAARASGRSWRSSRRFSSLMVSPSLLVVLLVVAFPLAYSLFLSFTAFTLLKPTSRWIGLTNYARLFSDRVFWQAFGNTLLFLFVTVNLELLL